MRQKVLGLVVSFVVVFQGYANDKVNKVDLSKVAGSAENKMKTSTKAASTAARSGKVTIPGSTGSVPRASLGSQAGRISTIKSPATLNLGSGPAKLDLGSIEKSAEQKADSVKVGDSSVKTPSERVGALVDLLRTSDATDPDIKAMISDLSDFKSELVKKGAGSSADDMLISSMETAIKNFVSNRGKHSDSNLPDDLFTRSLRLSIAARDIDTIAKPGGYIGDIERAGLSGLTDTIVKTFDDAFQKAKLAGKSTEESIAAGRVALQEKLREFDQREGQEPDTFMKSLCGTGGKAGKGSASTPSAHAGRGTRGAEDSKQTRCISQLFCTAA